MSDSIASQFEPSAEISHPRFFVNTSDFQIPSATIRSEEAHHLKKVLRLRLGDAVTVIDGLGREGQGTVEDILKDTVLCRIHKISKNLSEPMLRIALAQAVPKGLKMDEVIEMGTQLGIREFYPMFSRYCVGRPSESQGYAKIKRWVRIAKSALKQCEGAILPTVHDFVNFEDVLQRKHQYDLVLAAENRNGTRQLKTVLKEERSFGSILLLIGPEGGFASEEIERLSELNIQLVSLGKRRFRTELAGVIGAAMLMYEREM